MNPQEYSKRLLGMDYSIMNVKDEERYWENQRDAKEMQEEMSWEEAHGEREETPENLEE